MNIYQPTSSPGPPPLLWSKEIGYSVPPSESLWRDGEIRRGIEHALLLDSEVVREITKYLNEAGLCPLRSITVSFPYQRMPAVYTDSCLTELQESENKLLKDFAFDAYDSLQDYFGSWKWSDWFIAPYFSDGDDMHESVSLGVFVDPKISSEVIE